MSTPTTAECDTTDRDERPNPALSFRISDELNEALFQAEKKVGLKRSDVARKAIERGLPILVAQLQKQPLTA